MGTYTLLDSGVEIFKTFKKHDIADNLFLQLTNSRQKNKLYPYYKTVNLSGKI